MTELYINSFKLLAPNGSTIETTMVVGDYWATLTPILSLNNGQTYSVEAEGRINDSGTVKQILPGTWAFTVAVPVTDTLIYEDFSGFAFSLPHTLTDSEWINETGFGRLINPGGTHLVADPEYPSGGGRGTVLKIDFVENGLNVGSPGNPNGLQSTISWSGGEKNELYMAYDIFIPNSFIFNFMCKNMSFKTTGNGGDTQGTYARMGTDWAGDNSWTSNVLGSSVASVDGEIQVYLYSNAQREDHDNTNTAYTKGVWNQIEFHGLMNSTPSASDGEYHVWKNGQLIATRTGLRYLTRSGGWYDAMLLFYSGGSSEKFRQPQNQSIYLGNLIISENPITH